MKLMKQILNGNKPTVAVALKSLDQFIESDASDSPVSEFEQSTVRSRLAWRLISKNDSELNLSPVEQTASKRGGWNKGRIISWDDVMHRSGLAILPVDFLVLRMGFEISPYLDSRDRHIGKLIEALVGHPHVFLDDLPVTVQQGQVGLSLRENKGSWTLDPAMNRRPIDRFDTFLIDRNGYAVALDERECVVQVARMSPSLAKLVTKFMYTSIPIPVESQSEILKRLPVLEKQIPIGLPSSMEGELTAANETLFLRIDPHPVQGGVVCLEVQPVLGGPFFLPGEGMLEVTGHVDNRRVRVARDHEAERSRANDLTTVLALRRFQQSAPYSWVVASDDDILDLLDLLRQRPENEPIVRWANGPGERKMQVLGEVLPSTLRVDIKDRHDWFGLSGTIELAGHEFPLATLLVAIRGGRRYLDLGKGQFAAISKEFRDRLARVNDILHSNRGKLEFNATAAPVLDDLFDDQMVLKVSKKWRDSLKRLKNASLLEPTVPTTLMAELRDYQVDGYRWLRRLAEWGVGACLADDMGLGKTVQTLAVLLDRREAGPILIVAPVSVGFNWMRETARFAPTLNPILYRDSDREEVVTSLGPGDMLITSYHLMQQHAEHLKQITWGTLVLDEAQAVKNSQTKTAQVARELEAHWRVGLSGTPVENHLGDLWSVFRAISPGLFGSWERFRELFADPIEKAKDPTRTQALSRVIRPFILRRTKSEVLTELPARTEIQLIAEPSEQERRVYEDARLWAVTNLADQTGDVAADQRFQVLAALTKLRQIACHPRLVDQSWKKSSAKLDLFLETIDELRDGRHRALVFSQFTQHLAIVREALDERKIKYQYLDGSTPVKKRQAAVDAFQAGDGDLFLISLKAGGSGLNLTAADYVVHLDPWWNPAVEDQASDRAHRIGQTRPVTVYRLIAKGTIEEKILNLHADKRGLVAGILEGTESAGKLSTKELMDLIKHGRTEA
ncbi:DEAD/DEAH box helicase [Schlesneria paludicola]|uniref:DEAD/DEAH box helicase n=1 Tax=Schlesneria paludicola TaxID=360056 RepID=UPI00192B9DA3|nr:DEAD/DEAH box helicase [Schlesneria paludicola]